MQLDLVSSGGDPGRLREWLAAHPELRALLKKHGLQRTRRPEWSSARQASALEAIDALPKALRRAVWTRAKNADELPAGRQGLARIKSLVRHVDALLKTQVGPELPLRGTARDDLVAYMRGTDRVADSWRVLVDELQADLRLAVRLRDFCDYPLADALVALQPSGLSERLGWRLKSRRFRGRYRLTPQRAQALLRLRDALLALPANARAGRSDAASKPLLRAGITVWKAFGRTVDFTLGRPAGAPRGARHVAPKLSGDVIDFIRELFALAKLPWPTDAALAQMLRTLHSV